MAVKALRSSSVPVGLFGLQRTTTSADRDASMSRSTSKLMSAAFMKTSCTSACNAVDISLYSVNVGCGRTIRRPGPSVTVSDAWISSFEPFPTRIPSVGHSANLDRTLIVASGMNSGYLPHGRLTTRSAISFFNSGGSSYGFSFWSSFTSALKCLSVYAVSPRTSAFMTSDGDRSRMSCESFSDRKLLDHLSKLLNRSSRVSNDACTFHETGHAERRKKPGCPVRRQHRARSRKVISDDRWRVTSYKNGAGIADVVGNVIGFGHQNLNVFRRD